MPKNSKKKPKRMKVLNMYDIYDSDYFGGYLTPTFCDVFPNVEAFSEKAAQIKEQIDIDFKNTSSIYILLYGRYGNSHISFTDVNQFIYSLFSIIYMYGPTWEKRIDIQKKLRNLTDDQIITGAKSVHNHAYNPSTTPSTDTLDELPAINEQNTTKYKKNMLEAYGELYALLETDVTESFLDEFNRLFIKVAAPDHPLLYATQKPE